MKQACAMSHWNWVRLVGVSGAVLGTVLLLAPLPAPASDAGLVAAEQVSQSNYRYILGDMLGQYGLLYTRPGHNRGPSGAHLPLAREAIRNLMQSYGLTVTLEPFTYMSTTYHNVVGTKLGTVHPDEIYIIGAHYDSVSNPGADDNASGVALVLEAARVLSQWPSDRTIRFIAFSMEEQGLIGSDAYVTAHAGDDILGMISADMVAYDPATNRTWIYGRTASNPIKNSLAAAVTEYGAGLTYTVGGDTPYSDHAPFEQDGFQACLLIEGEVWNNPYYHTQSDNVQTAGNINYPYAVQMTRSVVGWLVDQAGVNVVWNGLEFSYPQGRPQSLVPGGGTTMPVEVTGVGTEAPQPGTAVLHYDTGSGWQSTPMLVVADNVYDAIFPPAVCGTPVAYYVSAQSQTAATYTDPRQAPASEYSAVAGFGRAAFYQNDLSTNPGWSVQGQWAWGDPTGGGSYNKDPQNGFTGTNVYGYNLSGDYGNGLSAQYLRTTAIVCTGRHDVQLHFQRWLGVESNSDYDEATVEVSNNGTTWTVIWRATDTGAAVSDSSWQYQTFDISAVADNRPTVYVRWGMGPTDTNLTYPGWNIDDVALSSLVCTPPPGDGDLDGDGDVDLADFAAFQECFAGGSVPADCLPGDLNGSDSVDTADVELFTGALTGPQ